MKSMHWLGWLYVLVSVLYFTINVTLRPFRQQLFLTDMNEGKSDRYEAGVKYRRWWFWEETGRVRLDRESREFYFVRPDKSEVALDEECLNRSGDE